MMYEILCKVIQYPTFTAQACKIGKAKRISILTSMGLEPTTVRWFQVLESDALPIEPRSRAMRLLRPRINGKSANFHFSL